MHFRNLTFNDLPTVVGELCKRIESLETVLKNSLAVQNKVKENHHVPMTVDEVCTYLGISKSSFYYKVKHGGIPVIKQGKHLFVYRDELDKWLETGRKVLKRILRLAGLPEDKNPNNLIMLALRKYAPPVRLAIVEQAIGTIPDLGLVIIDGIRDFLYDINSPSEATDIISRFMQWTDDRQIHIHTILHQNKNDENARGHIGTELNNKAETVMQVEVDKMDRTVSVVEAIHIRDREFEPFAFRINDEVLPELLDSYQPQEKKIGRPAKEPFDPYKEISESVHRAALDAAFTNVCITSYDDYLERLKEGYALQDIKLGHNKAVKVATFLSNKRMVIKEGKEYKINPDSHY
ncbi:MAG: helix-turn-helix domain-containing protein [Phocaeicola dorei]|uniref:Helix-turn-helix domain-containing protein n=1 Tax=Phocaeicola dorei TaxID=357276 RepID=A0A412YYU2_9BACT|nr:helix-turn-helix domain-containing protein [Phocaeicola dorei]MCD8252289.1 helix-turn-helix domain-containing protein [Phocaeicola dorei]RGV72760.1 helix-turn-helix domain-containing protein [Phocaeicola dorei]